jgi:hypothetical protein
LEAANASEDSLALTQSCIRVRIGDIERFAVANGPGVCPNSLERLWKSRRHGSVGCGINARKRDKFELIARDPGQPHVCPSSKRTALAMIASNIGWTYPSASG